VTPAKSRPLPEGLVTEEEAIRLALQWLHSHQPTQKRSDFGDKKDGGNLVSTSPCKENTTMENNNAQSVASSNVPAEAAAPAVAEMENHLLTAISTLSNNTGHAVHVQTELLKEMQKANAENSIKAKVVNAAITVTAVSFGVAGGLALFEYGIKPLVKPAV